VRCGERMHGAAGGRSEHRTVAHWHQCSWSLADKEEKEEKEEEREGGGVEGDVGLSGGGVVLKTRTPFPRPFPPRGAGFPAAALALPAALPLPLFLPLPPPCVISISAGYPDRSL
jgi:hypothetical protein